MKEGGNKPTDSILQLLRNMHKNPNTDISTYLINHFQEFTNNKIGSLLMESEVKNINLLTPPKFDQGKLVVIRERFNEYRWGLYIKPDPKNRKIKKIVLIKNINTNKFVEKSVFNHSIIDYPESELIEPLSYRNTKLNHDNLIEEYKL